MRSIGAALLVVLGIGAGEAAACAPPRTDGSRVVRAEIAGWAMVCGPMGGRPGRANAFCGLERTSPPRGAGVEVRSAAVDAVTLTASGRFDRMTINADDAPIELSCVVSQTTCTPGPVSRCRVPPDRAAQLMATLSSARDVVAALDGPSPATVPVDTAGFAEAWARYSAMLREHRGRAVQFVEPRRRAAQRAAQ